MTVPASLIANTTPTQRVEIMAWYRAKKALGTFKTKAREIGVTTQAVQDFIYRELSKERRRDERRRLAASAAVNGTRIKFYRQLKTLPF